MLRSAVTGDDLDLVDVPRRPLMLEAGDYVILASDGLWDVMSNEVACKVARNCLCGRAASKYPETVHGSSASDAAAVLVEFAMSRGSTDNISVVVVELKRLKRWKGGSRQNGRT